MWLGNRRWTLDPIRQLLSVFRPADPGGRLWSSRVRDSQNNSSPADGLGTEEAGKFIDRTSATQSRRKTRCIAEVQILGNGKMKEKVLLIGRAITMPQLNPVISVALPPLTGRDISITSTVLFCSMMMMNSFARCSSP